MLKRFVPIALLVPALLATSGCLVEMTVDAGGGGTVKAQYKVAKDQTLEQQKRQFASSNMTITNASLDIAANTATVDAKYTDLTRLSASAFFKGVAVKKSVDAKAGTTTITAKKVNHNPAKLPDNVLEQFGREFTLTVTFPGEVVKSNATETKGNTATWKMPLNKILADKEIPFEATYKTPAAATEAAGAKTPAADAKSGKKK